MAAAQPPKPAPQGAEVWTGFAEMYHRTFDPIMGNVARTMLAMADSAIPRGAQILDVACGSGAISLPAAVRAKKEGAGGRVVATDFAEGMVCLASEFGRDLGLDERHLRCEVQDGQKLTYPDASFDVVLSCFGIFLFPDRAAGWREAARVLKPGGLLVASSWQAPPANPMFQLFFTPFWELLPPEIPLKPKIFEVAEPAALAADVSASGGFEDVRACTVKTSTAFRDSVALWESLLINPFFMGTLAKAGPELTSKIRARLLELAEQFAGGAGRPVVIDAVASAVIARKKR
jgi:ubiquinone/menaquinone biosynthesis C-methylase UbiE